MQIQNKTCTYCKLNKTTDDFSKHKKGKNGLSSWCRVCHYERNKKWKKKNKDRSQNCYLLREYNITLQYWDSMNKLQKSRCAICCKKSRLNTDHYHKTGRVRGLLCRICNTSLGGFRDDTEILKKAIAYLQKP